MKRSIWCTFGLHAKVAAPSTGLLISHELMCRRSGCRARWGVLRVRDISAIIRQADADA